jgi:hypothetical protein
MGWSGLNRTEFDGGLNPREDADHVSTEEVSEGVAGACDAADARQQPLPGNSLSTKAGAVHLAGVVPALVRLGVALSRRPAPAKER